MQIRTGICADTNVICTDTDKYRYQNTYTNTYEHADRAWALEMSLTRPSFFLSFQEVGKKRCHWSGGHSAPSCRARRPQISQHLDTTSWWFNLALKHHLLGNSNSCVWCSFTLGLHKWPDSDKCLKRATLIWNIMAGPAGPPAQHFLRSGQHLKGQHFVYSPRRPLKSTFPKFRRFDSEICVECPIAMSCKPKMLLDSNTELQPIMHRKRK